MKNFQIRSVLKLVPEAETVASKKFSLALYKNVRNLEKYKHKLDKVKEPSSEFKKLEQLMQEKNVELADKDPSNNHKPKVRPVMFSDGSKGEQFVLTIPENIKRRDVYVNELRKQNAKIFEEQDRKVEKYVTMLNDDVDLKFKMVDERDLPEDINPQILFSFDWMIKFED